MPSVRPIAAWSIRLLLLAGLLGLAAITLQDRGTSLMFAGTGRLAYWAAVLAPLLALLLRATVSPEPLRLPATPWLILTAAAAAVLSVAALASPYRGTSTLLLAVPLAGLAFFLLAHDWLEADPANRTRGPVLAELVAGTLMLAVTVYWTADALSLTRAQLFSSTLLDMRNGHPLGHSSYTAGLALLSLPWLAAAAWRQSGARRLAAGAAFALGLLALFTSGSRGGLLGAAALGLTAAVTAGLGRKRLILLAAAALVATGLFIISNPRLRPMLGPADPAAALSASNAQRRAMLQAGLAMGADRPLIGWGLGTTPLVYPRYRARLDGGVENVLQLHSTPVELWAGLGAAGILLLGGFALLAARGRAREPLAFAALAGYGVFALTDYQLDVPVFALALAVLAAQLAAPAPAPAAARPRRILTAGLLAAGALLAAGGRNDGTPALNTEALTLARDRAQGLRAISLLRESLALNPDQEIAHFNLGWLLLVRDPAAAERHFLTAARLVPDKGGVYFGLGLARLNQEHNAAAAHAFALECLNDPRFLASPWWTESPIMELRGATRAEFTALCVRARAALPPEGWAARQTGLLAGLAPRLGQVSPGPEKTYRRERTGYPVLMRNLDLPPPLDLFDVREDPRFPASVPFELPPKGWLPAPLLLKLLDEKAPAGHR